MCGLEQGNVNFIVLHFHSLDFHSEGQVRVCVCLRQQTGNVPNYDPSPFIVARPSQWMALLIIVDWQHSLYRPTTLYTTVYYDMLVVYSIL